MEYEFLLGTILGLAAILLLLVGARNSLKSLSTSVHDPEIFFANDQGGTRFLFDGNRLIESSTNGRDFLMTAPRQGSDWFRLIAALSVIFQDVQAHFDSLQATGGFALEGVDSQGGVLKLKVDLHAGITRVQVLRVDEKAHSIVDPLVHNAICEDLDQQRYMLAKAPILAWREAPNGDVIWANEAYILRAVAQLSGEQDLPWPLPHLFTPAREMSQADGNLRQLIKDCAEDDPHHFDLTLVPDISAQAGGRGYRCYATPCDAAMRAENTLRDFMQTLTKTFAHLPIGLAIFDRQRLLHVFNPALLDLTGLSPSVLSQRPSLYAFLDALRERNVIPEPKDYRHWRRQIMEMERAAADGVYEEIWNLSNGLTYKVTGRPHPNGALALMIEDISHEVTRTRRYRADLELGQAVIDSLDEGIAVFTSNGALVMSNMAYAKIWREDPSEEVSQATVQSLADVWQHAAPADGFWHDAAEFVCTVGNRKPMEREVRLPDGAALICRLLPLSGGTTLIGFKQSARLLSRPSPDEITRRLRMA